MNWFADITPPGIKKMFRARDDKDSGLWSKCPSCEEMVFTKDLEAALRVCPNCDHHMALGAVQRMDALFGAGPDGKAAWQRIEQPEVPDDPLRFRDTKPYAARLKDYRKRTGERDALVMGTGEVAGVPIVAVVQNFAFMGGSMGMALGEGLIRAAENAVRERRPLVVFTASGGARMQEGILSLMQMPRSTIAVQMVREAGLPYIVVLTHPTTGGVTASYAMLGDVHLAEPGALIGFAGPRVIEQTIREKLPEGFQRSEYLRDHGMVDMVVSRKDLPGTLAQLLSVLTKAPQQEAIEDLREATAEAGPSADDRPEGKEPGSEPEGPRAGDDPMTKAKAVKRAPKRAKSKAKKAPSPDAAPAKGSDEGDLPLAASAANPAE